MKLSYISASGFFYHNNTGKFVSPSFDSYKLAQTLVQVKPRLDYFGIYLMKVNDTITANETWKLNNQYSYLSNSIKNIYGTFDQRPSSVDLKPLKVYMLLPDIAEQLIHTNYLHLSEQRYKDITAIVQSQFLNNFKYDLPGNIILPTNTVPKCSKEYTKPKTLLTKPILK